MTRQISILLHSSKTMRAPKISGALRQPQLIHQTEQLGGYLQSLSPTELAKSMHVSQSLADKTHDLLQQWTADPQQQTLAIDSFVGDIYSGLRASDLSQEDRDYADQTLHILSGLYGVISPYDGIRPYRLEMAYKLPNPTFSNLYKFWNDTIAATLPSSGSVVNLSSLEYTKAVLPFIDSGRVITPRFLTTNTKTGKPEFVVVHAKIARGAFARWLITTKITDPTMFSEFNDIGYVYDKDLSKSSEPVFVCESFGGIGLSMRLT